MSILQTIAQAQETSYPPLLLTKDEKMLWEGIVQKDISKVKKSLETTGEIPKTSYNVLYLCARWFDDQICELLFPKDKLHVLDANDVIRLLKKEETTTAFFPSLVAASNTLLDEKMYYNSYEFNIVLWRAGANLARVLEDPSCRVIKELHQKNLKNSFVSWVIKFCQPHLFEAANITIDKKFYKNLKYSVPDFENLSELLDCKKLWEQQSQSHQLHKIFEPFENIFPSASGGEALLTACILHKTKTLGQVLNSDEGCEYIKNMLEVSEKTGYLNEVLDNLCDHLATYKLEDKMNFDQYAQLFKICANYSNPKTGNMGMAMLLYNGVFPAELVETDDNRSDDDDDDDDDETNHAYSENAFYVLLRAAVYLCEDELLAVMDDYSQSWKPDAQKMLYEKHLMGLGRGTRSKKI